MGGKIGENSLNRVDYFDPIKKKWILGTPMELDRIRPTVSEDRGNLYVYSANSVERYDPVSNAWTVSELSCYN